MTKGDSLFLVVGSCTWGKGPTLKTAYEAMPGGRPRIKRDVAVVYEFAPGTVEVESVHVNDMGAVCWTWVDEGRPQPTTTVTDGRALLQRLKEERR